jgi:hypothetical protein
VILIDFPDFNLRLAAAKTGIPVFIISAPDLGLAAKGGENDGHLWKNGSFFLSSSFYESAVPVEFVGHPLLDVLEKWEAGKAGREKEFTESHSSPCSREARKGSFFLLPK